MFTLLPAGSCLPHYCSRTGSPGTAGDSSPHLSVLHQYNTMYVNNLCSSQKRGKTQSSFPHLPSPRSHSPSFSSSKSPSLLLPILFLLCCHPASSPGIFLCSLFLQVRLSGTHANMQLMLYQLKPLSLLPSRPEVGKGDLSTQARCNVFPAHVLRGQASETEMVYFQLHLWFWVTGFFCIDGSFFCFQEVTIPSAESLHILDFHFSDSGLSEDHTTQATIRMFLDLSLVQDFNIDYKVTHLLIIGLLRNSSLSG